MDNIVWFLPYRTEALTIFFKVISLIAEDAFIIAFLAIGYWCFNKKLYRDLTVLVCLSIMLNVLLKVIFKIPRPMIEPLIAINDDYSFPSGHAQITAVFWLMLASYYKRSFVWFLAGFMIIAQCLSRVYLGVHYMTDVVVGSLIGVITIIGYRLYRNSDYWILFSRNKWAMSLIFVGWLLVYYLSMIDDLNANCITAMGALSGVIIGHLMENTLCAYQEPLGYRAKWVIAAVGMGLIIALQKGLKLIPMEHGMLYFFGFYFILGLQITYIFPALFNYFYNKKMHKHALTK